MKTRIRVDNLTKVFRLYHERKFKTTLMSLVKRKPIYEDFLALKDISFEVREGECLGVIGANGSGKSTLLKLLAGILYADGGGLKLDGRVSTLIELNAGLHDDLTGLENIYLNAALFGLTKRQIRDRIDNIIDFSGLGNFIDTQTRYYSDGMRARLGFSVAIYVDADILLVDEALGVGDINFINKCYERICELKKKGVSIIFVSHHLKSIEAISDTVLWIEKGKLGLLGNPHETVLAYTEKYKR